MALCKRCSGAGSLPQRVGQQIVHNPCRACRLDGIAEHLYLVMVERTMGSAAKQPALAWDRLPGAIIDGWRAVASAAMSMER